MPRGSTAPPRSSRTARQVPLDLPWSTERLRLRLPGRRDGPELTSLVGDRRVSDPTTIPHPYRETDARQFVASAARKVRTGNGFDLLGFERSDGRLVGGVGLTLHGTLRPRPWAEVGYWVGPAEWGHGYASEMLATALDAGFRRYRLHRIEAWVHSYNHASIRVLERAGFREEGRGRDSIYLRRRWFDRVLFGLLSTERPKARWGAPRASKPSLPPKGSA